MSRQCTIRVELGEGKCGRGVRHQLRDRDAVPCVGLLYGSRKPLRGCIEEKHDIGGGGR
jgi:hypothetical protein